MSITRLLGVALTTLTLITGGLLAAGASASAAGTTWYVSPLGSDSATGTSPATAKRTLGSIATLPLGPGDSVLLQGGAVFAGSDSATVRASGTASAPITVGSYGNGRASVVGSSAACFQLDGSHLRVGNVRAALCGWAGFDVVGDDVAIDDVVASGSFAGVQVEQSASGTSVTNSWLHDNRKMSPGTFGPDDDSGAFGVLVLGDHTTVADNHIDGHTAPSLDYLLDGSAVEVFGAQDTRISDNVATGNQTFVEVGGVPGSDETAGVTLTGNRVTALAPRDYFLVVHAGDGFGAASGVRAEQNTAQLLGAASVGVTCGPLCSSTVLSLVGNRIDTPLGERTKVQGTYADS